MAASALKNSLKKKDKYDLSTSNEMK